MPPEGPVLSTGQWDALTEMAIMSWSPIPFGGTSLWELAASPSHYGTNPLFLQIHPWAVFLRTGTNLTPPKPEEKCLIFLFNVSCPQYELPYQEVWLLHGTLSYNIIFHLDLLFFFKKRSYLFIRESMREITSRGEGHKEKQTPC